MEAIELLNKAQESDEFRRTISTSALLWAASSIVVVLMGKLGWVASYKDALPFIILVTWLGSEIAARLPNRIPVAACNQCGRVQNLPRSPLRKFWPWKSRIVCGARLQYFCSNKHLLSLFADEMNSTSLADDKSSPSFKRICCSRCGESSKELTPKKFIEYLSNLINQKPKGIEDKEVAPLIWTMIRGTELGNGLRESMRIMANKYKPRRRLILDPDAEFLLSRAREKDPDNLF